MTNEFDIIAKYFKDIDYTDAPVEVGIGDDASVVDIPEGMSLATSVDALVSGVHFFDDDLAEDVAYKALAVNLSDMAAMGATPQWVYLSLTLPNSDERWLAQFSKGFRKMAEQYKLSLLGGDTTQGPLAVSIQIQGLVGKDQYLARRGAKPGDVIMVSGTLGDAGLGLQMKKKADFREKDADTDYILRRLKHPIPRVALGKKLVDYATAAIDISDGLLADLGHVLKASQVGGRIDLENLPLSPALMKNTDGQSCLGLACCAGDDYELCFTVPEAHVTTVTSFADRLNIKLSKIGKVTEGSFLRCFLHEEPYKISYEGYTHF